MNSLSKRREETVLAASRNNRERHRGRRERRTRDGGAGVSALMYAAQQGDVNVVRKIIGVETPSLFLRDRTGKTALHYSSTSGNRCAAQAADLMVMAAPDLVDGRDEDGFTPLHLAVIAGNMQLVTFLLANGADVNAVDHEKHTVVHWAAVCGETAALRAVLAAGAHVSTPDVHGGYPLHYAAQMCGGDRDSNLGMQVLQTLLSHPDIKVSAIDIDKREPLLWAASAGSARAVLALVRAGANVESADKDGLTALHCAASRGHTDCMDTLLTLCGSSIDIIDTNGCTALHYAVTLGHADATALLLAHGADPNRQDRKGRSPAHCGCAKGQFETVKLIGAHGANLWLRNARGDFPLHDAAASGRRELVKWLLEMRPSQVNARNNDGRCPLHMAALNDNADMCKILLDTGAQINPVLRTSKNVFMTPLDCALQKGYRSTAKYLQLHGGVPATRLSDPNNPQINSALNLQIRDDVTFYGDSSSDSERDNVSKSEKKTVRKKTTLKEQKKKLSTGSEKESAGVKLVKQKSVDKSAAKSEERRKTPSRFDYSNEIIINGKTEVNVTQTSELIIEKETVQTQTSAKFNEKERRPRSAKYGRLRDKSAQSSLNKETMISISSQASVSKKDHSTSTSDERTENEPAQEENAKTSPPTAHSEAKPSDMERKLTTQAVLHDQSSIMSYTSEDAEEPKKEIVVEAAVHPLPKSLTEVENKIDNLVGKEGISKGENDITDISAKTLGEIIEKKIYEIDQKELKTEDMKSDIPDKTTLNNIEDVAVVKDSLTEARDEPKESGSDKNQFSEYTKIEDELPPEMGDLESLTASADATKAEQEKFGYVTYDSRGKLQEDIPTKDTASENISETLPVEKTIKTSTEDKQTSEIVEDTKGVDQNTIKQDISDELHGTAPTEAGLKAIDKDKDVAEVTVASSAQKQKQDADLIKKKEKESIKSEHKKISPHKLKDDKSRKTTDQKRKTGKNIDNQKKESQRGKEESPQVKTDEQGEFSSFSDEDDFVPETHKSFRVLNDKELDALDDSRRKKHRPKREFSTDEMRSRSLETKRKDKSKKSKIPTALFKSTLSKSDRNLNQSYKETNLDERVPSLPNIRDERIIRDPPRCDSNMSAPLLTSVLSDKDRDSISDLEDESRNITKNKRFVKRRSKNRDSRSAGSDYESSNLIDSGFEPSPRSTRIPKWKNVSERGVNMASVTQNIQTNIRRYHIERKIFQQLLELKRHQIRAGQHNEAVLVKRAIDAYHKSCASTVGIGRYVEDDYTFKSFEKFLYEALRKLQKNGVDCMRGLPETTPINPLLCTKSTNRCMHAAHAYTGVPCAAYLPKMDHHTIPKIGFNNSVECKPGTGGFLPTINQKKAVTLELTHGNDKQVISLPTDKLDQNKRYYVTFTVKGHEAASDVDSLNNNNYDDSAHKHSKSD